MCVCAFQQGTSKIEATNLWWWKNLFGSRVRSERGEIGVRREGEQDETCRRTSFVQIRCYGVIFPRQIGRVRRPHGTTWHRGVRSAAARARQGDADRDPHRRRRRLTDDGTYNVYNIILLSSLYVCTTAVCIGTQRYTTTTVRHVHSPPIDTPPTGPHRVFVSAVWLSFVLCLRPVFVRVRCVDPASAGRGAGSEQRLAVCPFETPPPRGPRTRRTRSTRHRRRHRLLI